jgi:hypothetical protein
MQALSGKGPACDGSGFNLKAVPDTGPFTEVWARAPVRPGATGAETCPVCLPLLSRCTYVAPKRLWRGTRAWALLRASARFLSILRLLSRCSCCIAASSAAIVAAACGTRSECVIIMSSCLQNLDGFMWKFTSTGATEYRRYRVQALQSTQYASWCNPRPNVIVVCLHRAVQISPQSERV